MPCYTAWNDYLQPNTPEYLNAEREVRAKLRAVQHIVDYYYTAFSHALPQVPKSVQIDCTRQPRARREQKIREMLCHHFACDEVHFTTLYDVCTLLDAHDDKDRAYLAVIEPCAFLMRSEYRRFHPSRMAGSD
jgi:hypothetical protein